MIGNRVAWTLLVALAFGITIAMTIVTRRLLALRAQLKALIPLFESAFRNDVVSPPPARAAGIWQFIPQTARNYGLVVNDKVDERLDPEKETDAAMKLYRDLFDLFQDWHLALKAYNEGERRVQRLIDQRQTRDPWVLERLSTTESYLSGAIAMMIILRNPSLLD